MPGFLQGANHVSKEQSDADLQIECIFDIGTECRMLDITEPRTQIGTGGKAHVGGASHGALHQLDSLSPVIIAGGAAPRRLPNKMRSVDIAPLCMQILGIPMRYQVGDPRR